MSDPALDEIRSRNWLEYRWPIEIKSRFDCGATKYDVMIGQCSIVTKLSQEDAQQWVDALVPVSVADVVSRYPELHPVQVLIEGGRKGRLARIPPELWSTYDAIDLGGRSSHASILSAKARALFPGIVGVFVRIRPVRRSREP
ncbi:hypothetical protein NDN01_09945 [Sphingomonas sp. QA11]|uniref:hypothetical protein n=1 Tax=Sphingomonas sp. QA11 TaxID=2950605 RepID=UPI0023499EC1|nr:hypothetical protein [Sphingomonas sp. QA11]WCM29176.1 hypothetical protein NDN01_09945 [Sphingomonas sp. QA11]